MWSLLTCLLWLPSVVAMVPRKGTVAFGEFHAVEQRKVGHSKGSKNGVFQAESYYLLRKANNLIDILKEDDIWSELYLSMSMSMSYGAPWPSAPNPFPHLPPSASPPSAVPGPTLVPMDDDMLSSPPSSLPTAGTLPPGGGSRPEIVFGCTDEGISVMTPPYQFKTVVGLTVGYLIETSATLNAFKAELERLILETTLAGALQCETGGVFDGGNAPTIPMRTVATNEQCNPVRGDTTCTVYETQLQVLLGSDIDPEVGAFLGYVFLQEAMNGGTFESEIPVLDRIEYLHPLPLLPPITGPGVGPTPSPGIGGSNRLGGVSPWTYGAVIAMSIGGVIALWVWARNRRTRNERHMQLLEDVSLGSPPTTGA